MKLLERHKNGNNYDTETVDAKGSRLFKSILGCVPNVKTDAGIYVPLDNELKIITSHPKVKYVLKQGGIFVGFHNKITDKYMSAVKLHTGETLVKTALNDPACIPTVKNKRVLEWKYANGSFIREYVTEKKIKEVIFQKSGQIIKFKFVLTGLTAKNEGDSFGIYKGTAKAFAIEKPYYCTTDGEFISYVPITWEKVNGDWVVTYPAPAVDSYIDPSIVFGDGSGQTGGDHKDTSIGSNILAQALGGDVRLYAWAPLFRAPLMRFSLTGHIPTNAIVNTAVLTLTLTQRGGAANIGIHPLLRAWGVTNTDEGASENPATGGQATYRRSFDFNGAGGDVTWAAGNFSAADYGAAEDTTAVPAAINLTQTWSIPVMTQAWVNNDATNYGFCLVSSVANDNRYDSQEAVVLAERPYLTVTYTVPGGSQFFFFDSTKYKHRDRFIK